MFPALPYYLHSSARGIQLLSIYNSGWWRTCWTPREHIYKWFSGVLYSWHETAQKNAVSLSQHIVRLKFYQVQIIWIPIMKLNWLVWHMEHSCHYLFEWKAQDSPLHHHLCYLLSDELPIVIVPKSTFNLNHVHQYKHRQLTFCVFRFLFVQKANTVFAVLGSNNI